MEFAVADQIAAGLERLDGGLAPAIFVVPAVGRPVERFAEHDRLTRHADQIVGRIIAADAGRQTRRRSFGGWMQPRPFGRALDQSQRQFVDQHRGGFQVNPLVLEAHEQRPQRMILADGRMVGRQAGMGFDHVADDAIHLLAVGMDLLDAGPEHLVLGQVVPTHLVHAGLEQLLEIGIERLFDQAGHPQLVDIQRRRMPVIEDHRMAQMVVGRAEKGFLAPQPGKQRFGQGPGVVEISRHLFAGAGRQIRQRQRGQRAVRLQAGAVSRQPARPPPNGTGAREFSIQFVAQVVTPGFGCVIRSRVRQRWGHDRSCSIRRGWGQATAPVVFRQYMYKWPIRASLQTPVQPCTPIARPRQKIAPFVEKVPSAISGPVLDCLAAALADD